MHLQLALPELKLYLVVHPKGMLNKRVSVMMHLKTSRWGLGYTYTGTHVLEECTGSSVSLTQLIVSCLMTLLRIGLRVKLSSISRIRFDFTN